MTHAAVIHRDAAGHYADVLRHTDDPERHDHVETLGPYRTHGDAVVAASDRINAIAAGEPA